MHLKRRRPGKSFSGFQEAVARLPTRALRVVTDVLRRNIPLQIGDRWLTDDWCPLGCDGSRLLCPRTEELEQRLGRLGREDREPTAPMIWVTAIVHLRTGVLWTWRLGKGTASEVRHLSSMLWQLPTKALLVCDAAYLGFELASAIMEHKASFLFRVSFNVRLFTDHDISESEFREGIVRYWPKDRQREKQLPLTLRLLCIRRKARRPVWLVTNVLEAERLSVAQAEQFYRWRWENEGFFRSYKRTLGKLKLLSRTVRLVHREAESSLLAIQLLLLNAILRQSPVSSKANISVRAMVVEIRREIRDPHPKKREQTFAKRIERATRKTRDQKSPKMKRQWPQRKPHTYPQPPKLLTMDDKQKALLQKLLAAAA